MRERIRGRAAVWTLPLAFLVMSTASDAGQAPISFSTGGGDAWTFEKVIESSVLPSQCDEIAIASPAGTVTVRPDGDRAFARVPLESGDNTVVAECRKKGEPNGAPVQQNWFVRLNDVPKAQIHISLGQSGVTFDADASELAPARAAPIVDYEWRARNGNPSPLAGLPAPGPRLVLTPPAVDGDY